MSVIELIEQLKALSTREREAFARLLHEFGNADRSGDEQWRRRVGVRTGQLA